MSDSSQELLVTIGPDSSSGYANFLLLKHDFQGSTFPSVLKEINPGTLTGNIFSRFKRYIDYTNSKGYLICAEKSKFLFFVINTNTISLVKGFYYNTADSTGSAGDINMNSSNGKIYAILNKSSRSNIFIYDPSLDTFGDVYQTATNQMIYGIAAKGDNIYMTITVSGSTFMGFKTFNVQSPSDPDTNYPLTKVTDSLTISTDFSLVDSAQTVIGAVYSVSTPVTTVLTATPINTITNSPSYDSTGTCDIADPPPPPAPTPTPTPTPTTTTSTYTTSTETKAGKYTTGGAAFLTFAFSFLNSMSQGGSLQSFWTLINDYQLYQTLLLLGIYIPEKLIDFFTSFSFSTFSFNFLNAILPFNVEDWLTGFQIKQVNIMYSKIGLKYNSVFLNQIFLLLILFLVILSDALLSPLFWFCKTKCKGGKQKLAAKMFSFYHFKVYIRLAMQSFLFIMIGGNNEIDYYINGGKINYLSSSFALFYVIVISAFLTFVVLHYIITSCKEQITHEENYCKELYSDVKYTKSCRSYTSIYFFRRLAISIWVVFSVDRFGVITVLGCFSFIQFCNLIYKLIIRPFNQFSSNLIEILGDFQFFVICSLLIHFRTQERWTNTVTYIIMGCLIASSMMVCVISIIKIIIWIVKYCRKSQNKVVPKQKAQEVAKNIPSSTDRSNLHIIGSNNSKNMHEYNFEKKDISDKYLDESKINNRYDSPSRMPAPYNGKDIDEESNFDIPLNRNSSSSTTNTYNISQKFTGHLNPCRNF